jgi:hypothetical protein
MYSAISAEVPVGDLGKFNAPLFRHCVNTDKVLSALVTLRLTLVSPLLSSFVQLVVCGQALSHCVNFTVRDIVQRLSETGESPSMIYLLTDGSPPTFLSSCPSLHPPLASSSVMGFEKEGEAFVRDMRERGVNITTTAEFDRISNQN